MKVTWWSRRARESLSAAAPRSSDVCDAKNRSSGSQAGLIEPSGFSSSSKRAGSGV
jgi:hypothetical protein